MIRKDIEWNVRLTSNEMSNERRMKLAELDMSKRNKKWKMTEFQNESDKFIDSEKRAILFSEHT